MGTAVHKDGHGTTVRRAAFVTLAVLTIWGFGFQLYDWLYELPWFKDHRLLGGYQIPVIEQYIDPAFFLCWSLTVLVSRLILGWLNSPKTADFLIDTDSELKKVTWPTWDDAYKSSTVVIIFVVTLTGTIVAFDAAVSAVVRLVLAGGAK